jgi:hypothetical protein
MVEHILVLLVARLNGRDTLIARVMLTEHDLSLILVLAVLAHCARRDYRSFAVGTLKRDLRLRLAVAIGHALEVHTIPATVTLGAGVLGLNNPRVLITRILAKPTYGKRARLI